MLRLVATEQKELIHYLMEIFPEKSQDYLKRVCHGKANTPAVLNELISKVIEESNEDAEEPTTSNEHTDFEEQLENLKQILPDADPSYLEKHLRELIDFPEELSKLMSVLIESHVYPTKNEYLRKQHLSSQRKFYTTEFDVDEFLKVIPDPIEYFGNLKKDPSKLNKKTIEYSEKFLANKFTELPLFFIRCYLKRQKYNLFGAFKDLLKTNDACVCRWPPRGRYDFELAAIEDIPLLQEMAFVEHENEIKTVILKRKAKAVRDRKKAKVAGILQTCSCCFDDEVMPTDIYECENGCIFCKNCIRRGTEVAFGDGKLEFVCLNSCSSFFSLRTLQAVLDPKMFSKVVQKRQLQEVKAAGIEDLELCPYCDFATIPPAGDKIFYCLNPECMKETCRLCKEPAHVPLRCEEVEKKDEVDMRTYIENKMTEALLRKCYQCGISFIKSDGCNKMACSCGALMCYVCSKPVKDYKHFNGPGGDRFDLCPLYSDTNQLHQEAVLKGAEIAKKEKGLDAEPSKLKIDPTIDIEQHYKEVARKNSAKIPPLGGPLAFNLFGGQQQELREQFIQNRNQGLALLEQYVQHLLEHEQANPRRH